MDLTSLTLDDFYRIVLYLGIDREPIDFQLSILKELDYILPPWFE